MHLFLFISGIVLFPKVFTLKCHQCADYSSGQCSNNERERECLPGFDRCMALKVVTYTGYSNPQEFNFQDCAPASHCTDGSINTGTSRNVFISKCCTTDLCNNQLTPELTAPKPNGKKCMGCDGSGKCIWNLGCVDNEDYCFSATAVLNITIKGCTSKAACIKTGMEELKNYLSVDINCCQGDNCNGAGSTGGSLLLLVAAVVPLGLFS